MQAGGGYITALDAGSQCVSGYKYKTHSSLPLIQEEQNNPTDATHLRSIWTNLQPSRHTMNQATPPEVWGAKLV